jgi:branched-subunit amino acid transport protein
MMTTLGIVAGAALVTYATRVAGFAIAARGDISAGTSLTTRAFDRFLVWAPVAAFAALIVPDLANGPGMLSARLIGAAVAALAIWKAGRLWLGLASGFAAFWGVQLLVNGSL